MRYGTAVLGYCWGYIPIANLSSPIVVLFPLLPLLAISDIVAVKKLPEIHQDP